MNMKIKNTLIQGMTLLSILLLSGEAHGELTLAFDPMGDVVDFTVNVGETVDVPVYLVQTGSPIVNGDLLNDGIISMGLQLSYDSTADISVVVDATPDAAFFEFQETLIDNVQGNAAMVGAVGFTEPAVTGSSVLLGTFTFQGITRGNVTLVSVESTNILNTPGPYYVSGSNPPLALDSDIFPSAVMTTITTNLFVLGDVNQDGVTNLLDVGPFVELLSTGSFQIEADTNQDGAVNLLDVEPFVQILSGG